MNTLELIPIREPDRMKDEMLSFITAGTSPIMPLCTINSCGIDSGACDQINSCTDNTGSCGSNNCGIYHPQNQGPPCPNNCPENKPTQPCQGVTNS